MRLQAFLARAGRAPSRRKAEALIAAGRVTVDGSVATLGSSVSGEEEVLLDGGRVELPKARAYLALNKPPGYLTTLKDEPGRSRPTVADLMPEVPGLVPAGRLDADTTGLLILTNDGPFAHRLTHPSSEIEKEYRLALENPVPDAAIEALAAGPTLEDGKMSPPRISNLSPGETSTTLHLTIHEGRNRIIRRACTAVGLRLLGLQRVRIGPVELGSLGEGRYRPLRRDELERLR